MSDSLSNIADRFSRYIRQQKDLFGSVSVPDSQNMLNNDPSVVQETTDEETKSAKNKKDAGLVSEKSFLDECTSLEDLRKLCALSEELKTDLENTNLVFGVGNPNAKVMVIGEAPGEQEDKQGEPFVGAAGQLLNKILKAIDFERNEIYIANILKHRPPNNRNPKADEIERSLPFLKKQIELIDPILILCVGKIAATSILDVDESLKNLRNRFHTFMDREVLVTYHPAALLRNEQWKRPTWEDVQLFRNRYDELNSQDKP